MSFALPSYTDEEILASLKPYQQDLISKLLINHNDEDAARIWLSSSGPLDLGKFGGVGKPDGDAFFQRFCAEFRAYICGADKYSNDREAFVKLAQPAAAYAVNAISIAIAATLGVTSGLIFPAVALLLKVVGKVGLNAWCSSDSGDATS